ncbi:hypothetical protein [Candidatus Electronema sp. TJ]|uniref:hypothetical protein n=1 Tax=Candidatus Electronema sp. TJ TaxID=3401573 RepID=UPI003AA8BBE9
MNRTGSGVNNQALMIDEGVLEEERVGNSPVKIKFCSAAKLWIVTREAEHGKLPVCMNACPRHLLLITTKTKNFKAVCGDENLEMFRCKNYFP